MVAADLGALTGPKSDFEVKLFLSGHFDPTANPAVIAQYLRGAAKTQALLADKARFDSQYISSQGDLRGKQQAWDAVRDQRRERVLYGINRQMAQQRGGQLPATGPAAAAAAPAGGDVDTMVDFLLDLPD